MKTAKLLTIPCVFFAAFFVGGIALALEAPTLTVSTAGTTLSLSWTSVAGATGYTLSYAPDPYTGPDTIETFPLGNQTSWSATLWDGAAYFVAVQAYDDAGSSEYSNIEYFVIEDIPPIAVNPSSLSLETGETGSCTISGGTGVYGARSENTGIATVGIDGSTLSVTGVSAGSATVTYFDSGGDWGQMSVAVNTSGYQFPFKINNWNVDEGDNRWGDDGCAIYSDLVLKTTDDADYYTGFGAYTAPKPYHTRMIIRIIPYYEWAPYEYEWSPYRTLGPGDFEGLTNFEVDDGVMYFYKYLDIPYPENIDALLNDMAAGQTLGYTFFTDLKYYPTIHEEIPLDGFAIAKEAFEYCIQNHPN